MSNKIGKIKKKENDLQVKYYEIVINQKKLFMQFADERKERQKKVEQEANNDTQYKQEVEKEENYNYLNFIINF